MEFEVIMVFQSHCGSNYLIHNDSALTMTYWKQNLAVFHRHSSVRLY